MITLKNYTPHAINLHKEDGSIQTFESICGKDNAPRVETEFLQDIYLDDVRLVEEDFKDTMIGCPLPAPEERVLVIVSQIIFQHQFQNRTDLVYPSDMIRDAKGQITGCKAFSVHPQYLDFIKSNYYPATCNCEGKSLQQIIDETTANAKELEAIEEAQSKISNEAEKMQCHA